MVTARAGETFVARIPPPSTYTELVWKFDIEYPGYWFTAAQVQKIDLKVRTLTLANEYLTDKAAKECFDSSVKADKEILAGSGPFWLGLGAGVLIGGVTGFLLAKKL